MAEKRYEQRKQIKGARWLIFWVVLAQLAADMAVQAVVSFMAEPPHQYVQIGISELIALGVPIVVYGRSMWRGTSGDARKQLMLRNCNAGLYMLAAILGITGQFVMMLINIPPNFFMADILGHTLPDAVPVAINTYEICVGVITVVIIPAVLEEFWIRGLVFRAYNKCNTGAAVVFTSLVFAFLHLRLNEVFGFLFMGFVAVFILLKTRSLFAAMLYHAFSNLTALLFGFVLSGILPHLWLIFAAMTVLFLLSVCLLIIITKPIEKHHTFRGGEIFWKSVFSMPIFFSVCIVILRHFIV